MILKLQNILSVMMLCTSDVYVLITYSSFVESFFIMLSVSSLLYLRWKRPDLNRPIKVRNIEVIWLYGSTLRHFHSKRWKACCIIWLHYFFTGTNIFSSGICDNWSIFSDFTMLCETLRSRSWSFYHTSRCTCVFNFR